MRITCLVPMSPECPSGCLTAVLVPSEERPLLPQLVAIFGRGSYVAANGANITATCHAADVDALATLDSSITVARVTAPFSIASVSKGTSEYVQLVMNAFAMTAYANQKRYFSQNQPCGAKSSN